MSILCHFHPIISIIIISRYSKVIPGSLHSRPQPGTRFTKKYLKHNFVLRHGKYLFNITEELANLYTKPHLESVQPGFVIIDLPWYATLEEVRHIWSFDEWISHGAREIERSRDWETDIATGAHKHTDTQMVEELQGHRDILMQTETEIEGHRLRETQWGRET